MDFLPLIVLGAIAFVGYKYLLPYLRQLITNIQLVKNELTTSDQNAGKIKLSKFLVFLGAIGILYFSFVFETALNVEGTGYRVHNLGLMQSRQNGIIVSSLVAGIGVLLFGFFKGKGDAPNPDTHVKCPDCRELVLAEANKCKHCGCPLVPQ
jgi:hypothetical protein